MRDKLEGKEYVEELMHTLAHELKSPIAAIQGAAELMQENMQPAERERFLANILDQNQRQRRLIERMLALVQVEKQQRLTTIAAVDVRTLLDEVRSDFAAKLALKQLRLDVNAEDTTLKGDALLLRQAVGNLIDNAIEFAPAGSTIRVDAEHIDGKIRIRVADEGPGIPEYALNRVFERFYSLPRPNGAKSTGLGLPFVREVALLHNGSISVANGQEQGTVACLQIPLA